MAAVRPLRARIQPPATGDLLPARYIGMEPSSYAYHVYDVSPPATSDAEKTTTPQLAKEVRLTSAAVAEPLYHDTRMDWGATRCYTVRTFETIAGLTLQSDAPPPACVTLMDTFAPAAPKELQTVAERRLDRPDLGTERRKRSRRIHRAPRHAGGGQARRDQAAERRGDDVHRYRQGGRAVPYAVQAIDKAGNVSPMSNRKGDAAR